MKSYNLNLLTKIYKHQLFQVSWLNAMSVLVKAAGGLLAAKVTAIFIGPAGMALTGNLRNFLSSLELFSTLGLQNGIIKYVAENEKNEEKLYRLLSTIFLIILATIVVISFLLFIFSGYWSRRVFFGSTEFAWTFKLLAFALPGYIGNLVFTSVLNGLGRFKQVMYINIGGNIMGVLASALLIWKMQLDGAFIALILYPIGLFIFTFILISRNFKVKQLFKKDYFESKLLKDLFSYSLMGLVTAVLAPLIVFSVRNMIVSNVGTIEAGCWDGLNRIVQFYLMFGSTLLTVYYLPKLSIVQTNAETKAVFLSYYKIMLPLFAVGFAILYFIRGFLVKLLFTHEFLPMENLFFYQLLGDFFKIAYMVLGCQLIAKKQTVIFIVTEVLSFVMLYTFSYILIAHYGAVGAVMAYSLSSFFILVFLLLYMRKLFTNRM